MFPDLPAKIDESKVGEIWSDLETSILEMLKQTNSDLNFPQLYQSAYTLTLQQHGHLVFHGAKEAIYEHMKGIRDDLVKKLPAQFLSNLILYWKEHQTAMHMICDILMYTDRTYVPNNKLPNFTQIGVEAFRDVVLYQPVIRKELHKVLIDSIQLDRRGNSVNMAQVKSAIDMVLKIGLPVYEEEFESHFLEATKEFYQTESDSLLSKVTASTAHTYIKKVHQRLEEEEKRMDTYFHATSKPKLLLIIETILITNRAQLIVSMPNSGLLHMLTQDLYKNIFDMYCLFRRVPAELKVMSQCISLHIRELGCAITKCESKKPTEYIQELLDLKDKCDILLDKSLNNERIFKNQINSDFEYFINLNNHSAEYLSVFLDEKVKVMSLNSESSQNDETILDKCVVFFRLLHEKEVFEHFYKMHLAMRLLSETASPVVPECERKMVMKLKKECGCDFTSKLEGMFKDMSLSTSLMTEFQDYLSTMLPENSQITTLDMSMRVLSAGYWPRSISYVTVILPEILDKQFSLFSRFYLKKHSGRRLSLQCQWGHGEVIGNYSHIIQKTISEDAATSTQAGAAKELKTSRSYTLKVTTYQMIILNRYNFQNSYTLEELQKETNIPSHHLISTLQTLCAAKTEQTLVLKTNANVKDIKPTDVFSVNQQFFSKFTKIKVRSRSSRDQENASLNANVKHSVDINCNYVVECAIIRIMKSHKELTQEALINNVLEQLLPRFQPTLPIIQSRLESLIERDYLIRKADNSQTYIYKP